MKKQTLVIILLAILLVACLVFAACTGPEGPQGDTGNGISSIVKTSSVGLEDIYTITFTNGSTTTFAVTNGEQGIQGIQGKPGTDGHTPVITIQEGYWYIDGANTSVRAEGIKGETGNGISSIAKTSSAGLVDIYTITYTNGSTTTFTVTNGKDGQQGIQGIQGKPGTDGHTPVITIQEGYWYIDGVNTNIRAEGIKGDTGNGIASIEKTNAEGLVDTYTITFTDGTTTTFTVTNGKDGEQGAQGIQGIQGKPGTDGHTPVITIQEGYWYIDGVNTNVRAEGIKGDTGNGIASIEKTSTEGLVDTYTIIFTDGTTTTFTVTNGSQGVSIVGTAFDKDGNMVITFSDGTTQVVEHTWEKLYTLVEAGCFTQGKDLYSCTDCGLVRVVTVDKTEHNYVESVVAPTCTNQGYTSHYCDNCGDFYKDSYVDALGHNYLSYVVAPTCTSRGYTTHTCSVCYSWTRDTYVDAIDHTYTSFVTNPTCTSQGYTTYTCSGCNDSYKGAYVDALGHTEVVDSAVAPTCTATGLTEGKHCSVCGTITVAQTVVDTLSHNFQESDTCAYCEQNIADVAVDSYNMSKTADDNVRGYVVPRLDGKYYVYIKGTGAMKDYTSSSNPFKVDGYTLINAYIENGVTSIGGSVFSDCSSLTSITIPDSVITIGSEAFCECESLTSVVIGNSVTSIHYSAFKYCDSLTSIVIPDSVKSIGDYAFYCCSNLTSVIIGDSVTGIGEEAFYGCRSLTSIVIPASVTYIGIDAFAGCSKLADITIEGTPTMDSDRSWYDYNAFCGTAYYKDENNWENKVLYIGNCLIEAKTTIETCTIKAGTTVIADDAFYGCSSLTTVYYPGTQAQWNSIEIGSGNSYLTNANIIYSNIQYVTDGQYIYNWGTRGEQAIFLSPYAINFYTGNYTFDNLSQVSGGTSQSNAASSELYKQLQDLMKSNHTYINSYSENNNLLQYTDCENGGGTISSFYSGKAIGPSWGVGGWNKEHTWPNSKGLGGSDEDDVMMIRPTATSENSSRGNTAYGESSGYYNPNSESGGKYDLRGDCARIFLYVYTRWGNTNGNGSYSTWGTRGVMESLDVLLKWMEQDPVDTWEMGRNDAVQAITGTRNVFVDYPEYAWLLFGKNVPNNYVTPSGSNGVTPKPDDCNHSFSQATCTEPQTCTKCWATQGNALGHTTPDTNGLCTRCGEVLEEKTTHAGTQNDPYSIADVYKVAETLLAGASSGKVYVQGQVVNAGSIQSNTYIKGIIIKDSSTSKTLFINTANPKNSSDLQLKAGDTILLEGYIRINNTTNIAEMGTGNGNYTYFSIATGSQGGGETPAHECANVCPVCGKCTNEDCAEAVCAEKCEGHNAGSDEPTQSITTIADALAAEDGVAVELTGTVTGYYNDYKSNFYIEDETGKSILVYYATADANIGDIVKVVGTLGSYNGTKQVAKGATFTVLTAHSCDYSEATCLNAPRCAVCGETSGEALGHTDEADSDGKCDRCGASVGAAAGEQFTASKTMKELITAYKWTDATTKQSFNLDDNVTVKINGGNHTGKAYNGDHIRVYATDTPAGTITISVPVGYQLVSVKISTQTGAYAYLQVAGNDATDLSNTVVFVSGQSVVFNSVNSVSDGRQVRVTAIEVVYVAVTD